jgi:hypothetical protein
VTARKPDRFIFWYLAVSGLALAALVVIVAVLIFQISAVSASNTRLIDAQARSNLQQCQLANVSRSQDIAIWNRLLTVSPPPKSAAALAELADLKRLVRIKDAPRNCAAAYPGG